MSRPPVPGKANLHVALAMALGASPQESDKALIARVERLVAAASAPRVLDAPRRAARPTEGLFSLPEAEAS